MWITTCRGSQCGLGFFLSALLSLLPSTLIRADQPEDCPTWLPDLRCEREGRYQGFVPPSSAPYLFEDPFITTGLSSWVVWHRFPHHSAFDGGDARVYALQVRVALTDRLALIATRDGYMDVRPGLDLLDSELGWADLEAGFKYALIDWPEEQFILSPSLRFLIPSGSRATYNGNGDGAITPGLSFGFGRFGAHLLGNTGIQIPLDGGDQSTLVFYNLHLDYALLTYLVPFVELNGYLYADGGNGEFSLDTDLGNLSLSTAQAALGKSGFDGLDVTNLGSEGIDGNEVVTLALGARVPLTGGLSFSAAYEFPLTARQDILKDRVTLNVAWEF